MKKQLFLLPAALLLLASCGGPKTADPKLTPTMGWSSWNTFAININDQLIREQADAMATNGLKDAGYQYINIDDGYFAHRDSIDGHLLIQPEKFPNGLKGIVDYIHSLGLKAGIYTDAGDNTCASMWGGDTWGWGSGIFGHEQQDMDFWFVDCGFDFIKVDYCGGGHVQGEGLVKSEQEQYTKISNALAEAGKKVGRDDLRMNICRWAFPGVWAADVAGSWRTTGDIYNAWRSVKGILAENLYLSAYASPGHYNDMDMLEVGRSLSVEEDKTHFGMWCIMNSPLLIGCDMRNIKPEAMALMTNPELIALNQDAAYQQAYVAKKTDGCWILVKDLETLYGKKRAVAIYNPEDADHNVDLVFADVDLGGKVRVRDLFEHADLPVATEKMSVTVPAHGTRIYTLTADKRLERTLYEAETGFIPTYQELLNNQAVKSGIYVHSDACSGGLKAGWLGGSEQNVIEWRNVRSFKGGDYTLTIAFVTAETRNIDVRVNGTPVKTLSVNSGSWNSVATVTLPITLQKGDNVITLGNAESWMPDIDFVSLSK